MKNPRRGADFIGRDQTLNRDFYCILLIFNVFISTVL